MPKRLWREISVELENLKFVWIESLIEEQAQEDGKLRKNCSVR